MLVMAWLLIMGGLYWFFSGWHSAEINPNTANVLTQQQGDLTLLRNRDGHYVASGTINGRPVRFLLDTGATWVVVSMGMAAELGLKRGAALTLQTANGPTHAGGSVRSGALGPFSIQHRDQDLRATPGVDAAAGGIRQDGASPRSEAPSGKPRDPAILRLPDPAGYEAAGAPDTAFGIV